MKNLFPQKNVRIFQTETKKEKYSDVSSSMTVYKLLRKKKKEREKKSLHRQRLY